MRFASTPDEPGGCCHSSSATARCPTDGARPSGVYAPTLRFIALAAEIGARAPLTTMTSSALERLHAATGRPAMLTIPG